MSISWIAEQMECYPEYDGKPDVVFTVHWRANAIDGTASATAYGSVGLQLAEGSTFTPYENLTNDQVVGWVKGALGDEAVADIEASLSGQINVQKNPKSITLPLPWSAFS